MTPIIIVIRGGEYVTKVTYGGKPVKVRKT